MSVTKPYAESCEQNQWPILEVLRQELGTAQRLLEIGSGTGQHAVFFARQLPQLLWQTSDLAEHHAGILAWLEEAGLANVLPPLALDVRDAEAWPVGPYDSVFSANAVHIMSWQAVEAMFRGLGPILAPQGRLLLYGPFNYGGEYTSASNARFDQWLKQRDPHSGIRDLEALDTLAQQQGMVLTEDYAMPANNRILVWSKA